jgi:SAM-dependent methyltransferase
VSAFDPLAGAYDADFTRMAVARHLRARVQRHLLERVRPGHRALELGCGTGEDARALGERGVCVAATDGSQAMLAQARRKCAHLPHVRVQQLDLNAPRDDMPQGFHLVYANFGVLNCVHDHAALSNWLAARVVPGGAACFAVMSPLCVWEIGWHGLHGAWRTAVRRARGRATFAPAPGAPPITVHYPSPRALTAAFAPHFALTAVQPLGLCLPPTDLYAALERRPRLFRMLASLDDLLVGWGGLALFADHYWITFRRV